MSEIIMSLKAQDMDQNMFKHMQKLMQLDCNDAMWSCNSVVSQLVMVHFVRMEDPDAWVQARGNSYLHTVQLLIDILETNPVICEFLESLWSSHPDVAACINSASFQLLLTNLPIVHVKFIQGCGQYLAAVLQPGWAAHVDVESRFLKVQAAIATYLGAVQNLPLDGGHWHELWVAGDEVAVCLIEHFLMHEDQRDERWNTEHVRNPAKYLNRNLQNLRDLVAGNTEVCEMLATLRLVRPDIWAYIDGRAMQRIATCLRGEELLLGCANFLSQSLGTNWQEGRINPRAEVQRCIDTYVNNMFRLYGRQSEGRISPAWQPAPGYVSPVVTPRHARHVSQDGSFPSPHNNTMQSSMPPPPSNSFIRSPEQFPARNPRALAHASAPRAAASHTANRTSNNDRRHGNWQPHNMTRDSLCSFTPTISPRLATTSASCYSASPPSPSPMMNQPCSLMTQSPEFCPESPVSSTSAATFSSPGSSRMHTPNPYSHTLCPYSAPLSCPTSPTSSTSSHVRSCSEILDMWQVQQHGVSRPSWGTSHLPPTLFSTGIKALSAPQAQEWSSMFQGLWEDSLNTSLIPQAGY